MGHGFVCSSGWLLALAFFSKKNNIFFVVGGRGGVGIELLRSRRLRNQLVHPSRIMCDNANAANPIVSGSFPVLEPPQSGRNT